MWSCVPRSKIINALKKTPVIEAIKISRKVLEMAFPLDSRILEEIFNGKTYLK